MEGVPTNAWRWVARSMAAGAAYDMAFAAAMLGFPTVAASWLGIDLPPDLVYLKFCGILLLLIAGMYLLAARAPVRYQGVVLVAAAGRLVGFAYLFGVWWSGNATAFLWLALADLAFSIAHLTLLLIARSGERAAA